MAKPIKRKIYAANLTTLMGFGLFGILSAEAYYVGSSTASKLVGDFHRGDYGYWLATICTGYLLYVVAYFILRGGPAAAAKLLKSRRADVVGVFVAGALMSISFGGFGSPLYQKLAYTLTVYQILTLALLPFALGLLILLRALQRGPDREGLPPFFISDVEQKNKTGDLLDLADEADRFAERVWNNGSIESMVFGIDAPWGIGKSSFVNFCRESWEGKHRGRVILYNFNPLRYEDRANLLEKFVDGLVRVVQKHAFVPEIRPLVSKYSRFIKSAKASFSFLGVDFELAPGTYTVDDAFADLESALTDIDRKIVIVIDDLDRLDFSAIKDVLSVIKKSFNLPNVSYVLCYDTENINVLERERPDVEKVTEFLEKFVNVKVGLYLDSETLAKYVSTNLARALVGNSQADPKLVSAAVGGLIDIYKSPEFHRYLPFIGDVRKIKRFINTLLLLEIEKADFKNSDFDKQDLVHLLLIYINYPSIFRKIYNAETNGRRGFFSVAMPLDDNYPKDPSAARSGLENTYKNSTDYEAYVKKLTDNQKFLLGKIFDVPLRLKDARIDGVPQEAKHVYACFNGGVFGGGQNLEAYLNLIVKLSKPQKSGQYKFYANLKDEIRDGKKSIDDVLSTSDFSYDCPESNREQLWKVIINSLSEFKSVVGSKLIVHLLGNMQNYSLFTNQVIGVGLRDDLDIFLTRLLDQVGWKDQKGEHTDNTPENISEIAEWVFGEGRHAGQSVLLTLAKEDRGTLGLYDLLCFRLFCSADRGGDIFNLSRALSKHGDPNAPTDGSIREIAIGEMREISQAVFGIFKSQYIDPGKNIFDLIDGLSLADFAGKYQAYIEGKVTSGEIENAETTVADLKSRMKSFITYQLTNTYISSGVGCGYYDPSGKEDAGGISHSVNDYLFGTCFNPSVAGKNYEHFLDYLLINFASTFESRGGREYTPHINEFTKILDKSKLAEYWREHATTIRGLNLTEKEKTVITSNYSASYKDDLAGVFQVLDKLIEEPVVEAPVAPSA
ncbi:MAG: P-loop NTPase fold protein [Patescibacteria group bacterium]|nr:MAG: P-loop NTPase fold protein [Patescibacteria group bacterium]